MEMTSKKDLSERDICTKYILPALVRAGWDVERQIREEVFFTNGRIFVKGDKAVRGERKRADFILYARPNIPVAVIEAKDNNHPVSAGIQQALDYAHILDVPVAFSSNGDGFIQHDRSGRATVPLRRLGRRFADPQRLHRPEEQVHQGLYVEVEQQPGRVFDGLGHQVDSPGDDQKIQSKVSHDQHV